MRRLIQFLIPLLLIGLLAGPVGAAPFVIDDDGGGEVSTFQMWYERVKEAGVPVRLRGICMSACTFVLILPPSQVCVEPTASLGFHLAADKFGPDPAMTAAIIRRSYPQVVQDWLKDKKLALERMIFMDAETIVKLGIFPACDVPAAPAEDFGTE